MMTAEELKASILQLAMQGKLVEQRPEEGNGEELYQEIQKEKQRLIKEGKLKKDQNLSSIRDDNAPFDIPANWKWVYLDDLVIKTIKRGKSPKYVPISSTLVFAQKCNTKAGTIDLSLCQYLDEEKLKNYPEEEFMQNFDIVLNSTGNGTLGRVGVYRASDNKEHLPIVPDSHVTVVRCCTDVNRKFIFWGLKYYQPYMEKLGSGSTNQTELSANLVKQLYFPLPPLAEQNRIVAKIEELMPVVDQYAVSSEKLNALNTTFPDQMKKSILQQAVQGKLVPQDPSDEPASVLLKKIAEEKQKLIKKGKIKKQKPLSAITEDEIPFEIPESWEWVRVGDIGNIQTGTTPSKSHSEYFGADIPFVSPGDILVTNELKYRKEGLSKEGINHARLIPANSVMQVCIGGSIGKAAINDIDVTCNQQINTVTPFLMM